MYHGNKGNGATSQYSNGQKSLRALHTDTKKNFSVRCWTLGNLGCVCAFKQMFGTHGLHLCMSGLHLFNEGSCLSLGFRVTVGFRLRL